MDTQPMTAADHLAKGERLLADADTTGLKPDSRAAWAAQAQAHFAAARLLFDLEAARMDSKSKRYALEDTGLEAIVDERRHIAAQRPAA